MRNQLAAATLVIAAASLCAAVKAAPARPSAPAGAEYFYDAFPRSEALPRITPAPGRYSDTIMVSLQTSIYDPTADMRYTTDGSQPGPASALYSGPFGVSRSATVRARAFHDAKPTSSVVSTAYQVNDVTAPAIVSVLAFPGSANVYVSFSESVDAPSASDPASYSIPGLTVTAATPGPGERSVALTVSPAPSEGRDYALSAGGVKDTSPNANAAGSSKAAAFRAAAPVVTVRPDGGTAANVLGAVKTVDSPHGRAYSFNAGSDAVELVNRPELNPTQGITIAAWINSKNWNGNRRIAQKGNNDDQYRLTADEGKLVWEIAGVGDVSAPLPTLNAWHHVAATYDRQAMKLYVDGQLVGQTAVTDPMSAGPDHLFVGTKYERAASSDRFIGDIADLRVYGQALLPEHIAALAR